MTSPIKTAVVGFGLAGRYIHAPFLATQPDRYDIVGVLERNKSESRTVFPKAKIFRTMDELLSDQSIELVIITTPNDTHFPYATYALQAGKHVVVDKPFTITSWDALKLMQIQKQSRKILSVFQNRRYDNDFRTIQDILSKDLIGDVLEYEAHFDRYAPEPKPNAWRERPEPGAGTLYDLGPHLIDQALCLFGKPTAVLAEIRRERSHAKASDYFDIELKYPKVKAILRSSMLVKNPGARYYVGGSKGVYTKSYADPQEAQLRQGMLPIDPLKWGIEQPEHAGMLETETSRDPYPSLPGNYGLYYENLFKTIRENAPLSEKPEHGHNTVRIIELAMQSSNEQREIAVGNLL